MRIPDKTEKTKFFVAINETEAYAECDTFNDALNALLKFEEWSQKEPYLYEREIKKIKFIVEVGPKGKTILWTRK